MFSFLQNNTLSRAELDSDGEVLNIHYGDVLIKFGSILDCNDKDIPHIASGHESQNYQYLQNGDIIIADTAEDETVGKATELVNVSGRKVEAGLHTIPCRPLSCFASMYLGYYMNTPHFHRQLIPLMQGIKVLSISKGNIAKTKICAPKSMLEQQKISYLLNVLDRRTAAQRKVIEVLKKYKRGVFEAIFSRKLRLLSKEEQRDWKIFKLSDFASRIIRKNNGTTDNPLTISAQYGLIDQRDFFSKVVASADMSGYYLLRKGEYAYNRSTSNDYPFGSIKRLELYDKGAVSTLYLCFSVNENVMVNDFVKWYFESSQWYRSINEICAEGARNHGLLNVPTDGFFNTTHILPTDTKEQTVIATFLSLIQEKLEISQKGLNKLTELRNGLMQQLFI